MFDHPGFTIEVLEYGIIFLDRTTGAQAINMCSYVPAMNSQLMYIPPPCFKWSAWFSDRDASLAEFLGCSHQTSEQLAAVFE